MLGELFILIFLFSILTYLSFQELLLEHADRSFSVNLFIIKVDLHTHAHDIMEKIIEKSL